MRTGFTRDFCEIVEAIPTGERILLVGDRVIDFWVDVLGIRGAEYGLAESSPGCRDLQFLGPAGVALAWGQATGSSIRLAIADDGNCHVTALLMIHVGGRHWSAEFLNGLTGFSAEQLKEVRQSAMPIVRLNGGETAVLALHPVQALRQQLASTYGYSQDRRNEPDGEQYAVRARLAIEACRRITLRYLKQGDIAEAVRIVEAVHRISLTAPALRAHLSDGVRLEDAIVESDVFPKEFRRKRLRHLRGVHKRKMCVYRKKYSHLEGATASATSPSVA
ncbi:MAG: hypothetical protein ACRETY_07190 [Steroidobacteraceae bacterium]